MAQSRTTAIRVVEGTEAKTKQLGELFSTRSAYEYIVNADTLSFPREVMARCNINKYLEANLTEDAEKTRTAREDILSAVSPASGLVQSGQRIIDRGEIVSADQYKILQSFQREYDERNDSTDSARLVIVGQILFVASMLLCFVAYLKLFRREYLESPHSVLLLSTLIAIFPLFTYLMVDQKFFNVYIVPYAMVPIFVRIFMDSRTAFMAMVCSVMLSSLPLHANYEFLVVETVAGMTALCALKELTERAQLLKVALLVVLTSWAITFGYDLSQGLDIAHLDRSVYFYIAVNGVILLFAYPLLYLLKALRLHFQRDPRGTL